DFDSRAHVCRGPGRAYQLQSTPQRLPFPPQAAALLPGLQSQRGALRSCKRLRIRQGSIRSVQRRRTDKIEPPSARVMEIIEFVKLDEMDPLYFDSSYYITPEDPGLKAYMLLMKAMQETGYGAIAKITMHQREHIVIIRPGAKNMTLHT